jgi:large subunit ribosomal protein LP0
MGLSRERKAEYFERMEGLVLTYSKILTVTCDNVGSKQFQTIRISLRGRAVILMGKNTMMRKVLNTVLEKHPGHPIECMLARCRGNTGFVFTNEDPAAIQEAIATNIVPAPARVGAISPCDVVVPPGPTDCDPGQTNFFQTLQIATKIVKGRIEIVSPVNLLKKGDKVGNSEAVLLDKLHVLPFTYGLVTHEIYDNGAVFAVEVLAITDEVIGQKFAAARANIAALSLALGYPTAASVPHSIANAFKALVAIAVECEGYSFDKADAFKKLVCVAKPKEAAAAEGE